MSGLWGRSLFGKPTNAGRTRLTSACGLCGMPVSHYTARKEPMHGACAAVCVRARFQLEREGLLPKHANKLDGVFTDPLVLARALELRVA